MDLLLSIISCSVLWQANIVVIDISEQITPVWDFFWGGKVFLCVHVIDTKDKYCFLNLF